MTESRELLDDLQASTPDVRLGLSRAGVQGVAKAIRLRWGGAEKLISARLNADKQAALIADSIKSLGSKLN